MTRVEQIQVSMQHFKEGRGRSIKGQTLVFIKYLREYYNRESKRYHVCSHPRDESLLVRTDNWLTAKRLARHAYFDFGYGCVKDASTQIVLHEYK